MSCHRSREGVRHGTVSANIQSSGEGIERGISWRFVGGAAPVGERGVSGQPGVAWTASAPPH